MPDRMTRRGAALGAAIEEAARALAAESGAFTRRNLLYATRRATGSPVTREALDAFVGRPGKAARLPGLLPERTRWRPPRLTREWDAYFPQAVVVVDRPAIVDLFVATGAVATGRLAVVCIDGTPAPVIDWLKRGYRAGRRAPVLYVHDAATVVYPFAFEPLATLVRHATDRAFEYRNLGLLPLGSNARRFEDARLPAGEPIVELEALPPATLVRFVMGAVLRLLPPDPNMLPISRERERQRLLGASP